ncbi:MAG TPA: hypothetical protein VGB17_00735 [Pyrinomonadaceae bacterium]|jgi:hypothetical protein
MRLARLLKISFATLLLASGAIRAQAQQPAYGSPNEIAPLRMTAVEEASAPAGWKRYQFGDPLLFSAILPGAPQAQSEKFTDAKGPLVVRLYMAASPTGGVYGLNYAEAAPTMALDKSETESRRFFTNYMAGFIAGFKKGLQDRGMTAELETQTSPERRVKISGLDGYEQDIAIGPFNGRSQVVFLGRNIYAAIALWNQNNPLSERTAFFNSFQIRHAR